MSQRLGAATGDDGATRELSNQLSRIQEMREELARLERQISELSKSAQPGARGAQPDARDGQAARDGQSTQNGQGTQNRQGTQNGQGAQNGQGPQNAQDGGAQGRGQGTPTGDGDATPWDGARELLGEMRRDLDYRTPAGNEFNPGRSAPGTEGWKQDFAQWEELKVQLAAALERAETTTAAKLRAEQATDRLNAGAGQQVPEEYRRLVDQYYRSLATRDGGRR